MKKIDILIGIVDKLLSRIEILEALTCPEETVLLNDEECDLLYDSKKNPFKVPDITKKKLIEQERRRVFDFVTDGSELPDIKHLPIWQG